MATAERLATQEELLIGTSLADQLEQAGISLGLPGDTYSYRNLREMIARPVYPRSNSLPLRQSWFSLSSVWYSLSANEGMPFFPAVLQSSPSESGQELREKIESVMGKLPPYHKIVLSTLAQKSNIELNQLEKTGCSIPFYKGSKSAGCSLAEPRFCFLLNSLQRGAQLNPEAIKVVTSGSVPIALLKDAPLFGDQKVGLTFQPVCINEVMYPPGFLLQFDFLEEHLALSPSGMGYMVAAEQTHAAAVRPSSFIFNSRELRWEGFSYHYHEQLSVCPEVDSVSLDHLDLLAKRVMGVVV